MLSKLLMHGNRKRGIEEIERALKNGRHARVEAILFLIDIYTSWEKQPEKAVSLARQLYQKYPQSPAMHLALIGTLSAAKQWDLVSAESEKFLKLAHARKHLSIRRNTSRREFTTWDWPPCGIMTPRLA